MYILSKNPKIFEQLEPLYAPETPLLAKSWEEFCREDLKSKGDFLVVELSEIKEVNDSLFAQMNTYTACVILADSKDSSKVEKIIAGARNIIGIFTFPLKNEEMQILSNQLQLLSTFTEEKKNLRLQMVKFSEEIDHLVHSAEAEMLKAKRIHESVVPKRVEEFKGLTLMSKYAVGSGSGSEYFDLIRGSHHSYLIIIHTNSYLASSSLMGIINKYKGETTGLNFELFMNEAELELQAINAHKKKPVKVEMFLMSINNLDLGCSGYSFGSFDLISQLEDKGLPSVESFSLAAKSKAYFEFKVVREEKVIVFSPGFIFNWNEQLPGVNLRDFTQKGLQGSTSDFLVEIFFQLKKKLTEDFLSKDATAIVMEVKRHAIQKV